MADSSEDDNQELTQARNGELGELAETLDRTDNAASINATRERDTLLDRIRSLEQQLKVAAI
jgi:transcription elongation GreA/GreB family factor